MAGKISDDLRATLLSLKQISARLKQIQSGQTQDTAAIIEAIGDIDLSAITDAIDIVEGKVDDVAQDVSTIGTNLTAVGNNVSSINTHVGEPPTGASTNTVFQYLIAVLSALEGQGGGGGGGELPPGGIAEWVALLLNFFGITDAIDYHEPIPYMDIVNELENTWELEWGTPTPQLLQELNGTIDATVTPVELGDMDLTKVDVEADGIRMIFNTPRPCDITLEAECDTAVIESGETISTTAETIDYAITDIDTDTEYTLQDSILNLLQTEATTGTITNVTSISIIVTPEQASATLTGDIKLRIYDPGYTPTNE